MGTRGYTILITGGSTGIGLAMAKALAAIGNAVIGCGPDLALSSRVREIIPSLHTE